jgi:hypothetical protein
VCYVQRGLIIIIIMLPNQAIASTPKGFNETGDGSSTGTGCVHQASGAQANEQEPAGVAWLLQLHHAGAELLVLVLLASHSMIEQAGLLLC